jgi:hypothetical protein
VVRLALGLIASFVLSFAAGPALAQQAPYKIVVLAGEDSVNVIQQKTAVAPLVEVRDRNNQPVPGAVVTFAVQGGKAAVFQGGATTMTIATNAAGQAAAAGLTPLTAGAVNISVEAAVQGQIVTAAITQVNVMTAAEAAAAAGTATGATGAGSGSAAGSTSAAGGAAGGGGGISGTTVGIIGGVAAAGAVVGAQAVGGDGETATSARPSPSVFRGPFSMNVTLVFGGCSRQETYAGALTITLESTSPTVNGKAEFGPGLGTGTVTASTCPQPVGPIGTGWSMPSGPVTGTESSMVFNSSDVVRTLDNNGDTFARSVTFTGALSGGVINGQIHMVWRHSTPTFPLMDMQASMTLTKQ